MIVNGSVTIGKMMTAPPTLTTMMTTNKSDDEGDVDVMTMTITSDDDKRRHFNDINDDSADADSTPCLPMGWCGVGMTPPAQWVKWINTIGLIFAFAYGWAEAGGAKNKE